jgi:hypothetical protein
MACAVTGGDQAADATPRLVHNHLGLAQVGSTGLLGRVPSQKSVAGPRILVKVNSWLGFRPLLRT